jgi:outer membrane cobalamin receptor
VAARDLEGTVRDAQTLLPIPQAVVELLETGITVTTDSEGRFRFLQLPNGVYHLCIGRIGYVQRCGVDITIGAEEFLESSIYLTAQPLQGEALEVTALRRQDSSTATRTVVTRHDIVISGAQSAADVLERTPDIEVLRESSGSARVSIRGSNPEAVKVLMDHVPLTADGSAADLASIPASRIEKIEIIKGPAAVSAGADAMAGAVLITTRAAGSEPQATAGAGAGSFNRRDGEVAVDGLGWGTQRMGLAWSRRRSDGDFTYFDEQFSHDTVRTNNDSYRQNVSVKGNGRFAEPWRWHATLNHYQVRAGIPGAEFQLTPDARREQKRYVGSAGLEYNTSISRIYLNYGITDDWNYFVNTGTLPYETENEARLSTWMAGAEIQSGAFRGLALSGEIGREELKGTDHLRPTQSFGEAHRDNFAATLRWSRSHQITSALAARTELAYRYDRTETEAEYPTTAISPVIDPPQPVWEFGSPQLAGGLFGQWGALGWSADASYGKAFRRPPLLEQFWVESYRSRGNPGLKPERSEQIQAGYALRTSTSLAVEFQQNFFWSDYEDLIIWLPGQGGVWSPDNIGSARIDGREESLQLSVAEQRGVLRVAHLFADHENTAGEPNTDGEPLPFRYRHKYTVGATGNLDWTWLDAAYRWFDRRYLREAGTASKSLDPYGVLDLASGWRGSKWGLNAEFVFRLLNVTDARYEVIEREPMPGRNFSMALNITTALR